MLREQGILLDTTLQLFSLVVFSFFSLNLQKLHGVALHFFNSNCTVKYLITMDGISPYGNRPKANL